MPQCFVNCKGLPCPEPVLRCREVLAHKTPEEIKVVVDSEASADNVSRYLANQGYGVAISTQGNDFAVTGRAPGALQCQIMGDTELQGEPRPQQTRTLVFITDAGIGSGDEGLAGKLMFNFLSTLPELGSDLWRIILVNGGVELACDGHACLEKLMALEKAGVSILVCGTCLEHFKLLEKKRVGQTTNMLDVVTSLATAGKVVQV